MRALSIASLLFASVQVVVFTRPAIAESSAAVGADEVIHLKNGGQLRGTIIDVIPGVHARIRLTTGEVATIPWNEIASVDSARTPSPPPQSVGPQKRVHIEAPRQVSLE